VNLFIHVKNLTINLRKKWAFLVSKSGPLWYPYKVGLSGMGLSGIGPF